MQPVYQTSREFRNKAAKGKQPFVGATPSNFAKVPAGEYGAAHMKITVAADGTITIPPAAYADDVVAFVASVINGHGGIDASIKELLQQFVRAMDERAVKIHGYSGNEAERDYVWE